MSCSLITFHEEPPSAAFPVSNGGEPSCTNTWKSRVVMPTQRVGISKGGAYGSEPLRGSTLNGEAVLREPTVPVKGGSYKEP